MVLIRQDFVNKIVVEVPRIIMQIFSKIVNVKKDVHNHQYKHMDKTIYVYLIVHHQHGLINLMIGEYVQHHVQIMIL